MSKALPKDANTQKAKARREMVVEKALEASYAEQLIELEPDLVPGMDWDTFDGWLARGLSVTPRKEAKVTYGEDGRIGYRPILSNGRRAPRLVLFSRKQVRKADAKKGA